MEAMLHSYILVIGLLYPAYRTLMDRTATASDAQWNRYWTVFAVSYVLGEFVKGSVLLVVPLLSLLEAVYFTLLVLPDTGAVQHLHDDLLVNAFRLYVEPTTARVRQAVVGASWQSQSLHALALLRRAKDLVNPWSDGAAQGPCESDADGTTRRAGCVSEVRKKTE